jgi:hypothetical protein
MVLVGGDLSIHSGKAPKTPVEATVESVALATVSNWGR